MLIQCTKKLLDELKMKPEARLEEEPLFSWHGHLLMINRRKTVVLVNDQNRYVVVLHGLKAKDMNRLDEIILQGIRETLQAEGILDEVIEKYLLSSKEVTYTKTKDRTSVARMNKACEEVYFYGDLLDNETLFNTRISQRVSRSLFGNGRNDYIIPNEEMFKDLKNLVEEPIFCMKALQLKVTLELEDHQVWRRIIVPVNRTFDKLHDIIQAVFGWKDYHLHEFYIFEAAASNNGLSINHSGFYEGGNRPILNLVSNEEAFGYPNDIEMMLETGIKLSEYIPAYKKLKYNYDFGDNWEHYIEVEDTIDDYDVYYPVCLEGEGNTPPEDVGGSGGYAEFLQILSDPKHADYEHMVRWSRMQGYKDFDMQMVNHRLKYL